MAESNDNTIHMQSGVSAFTGEPFIALQWGEQRGQLTVAEAREHAFAILETCEAAESDAFLYKFMREKVNATEERAAMMLVAFREYRDGAQPPPQIPENEK